MNRREFKSRVEHQMLHLDSFTESLNFNLSFRKTDHAEKRQERHSSKITDEEIKATVEEVSTVIKSKILDDEISPGDELVIRDQVYNLNLVTKLQKKSTSSYNLLIETVMLSRDFDANPGQKVVDIFNS